MELIAPLNDIFPNNITRITHTLVPPGFQGDIHSLRLMQENLSRVIDALGVQSAAAQGLNKVITTAEKLRNSPTHVLYLLKDSIDGAVAVVGLLKVGRKRLFLFDEEHQVRVVEPLCVLDFYVRSDCQRKGFGKLLYDHMLKEEGVTAEQIAVDGPSLKMEKFLSKNYGMDRLIRQCNNFAVCPQFFAGGGGVTVKEHSTTTKSPVFGRYAAPKPQSDLASVIHGGESSGVYYNENSSGGLSVGSSDDREERGASLLFSKGQFRPRRDAARTL